LQLTASQVRSLLVRETVLRDNGVMLALLLTIVAVVLVIWGIVTIVNGGLILGIILIVIGLIVGPGGYSVFNR
jgi:hypothetical protein